MKNSTFSTLQAAGIAMACWLLPTVGLASVEVDGLFYDLNKAKKPPLWLLVLTGASSM